MTAHGLNRGVLDVDVRTELARPDAGLELTGGMGGAAISVNVNSDLLDLLLRLSVTALAVATLFEGDPESI
jgi:3-hydroxy-3-methylglutaryl CoA synthase